MPINQTNWGWNDYLFDLVNRQHQIAEQIIDNIHRIKKQTQKNTQYEDDFRLMIKLNLTNQIVQKLKPWQASLTIMQGIQWQELIDQLSQNGNPFQSPIDHLVDTYKAQFDNEIQFKDYRKYCQNNHQELTMNVERVFHTIQQIEEHYIKIIKGGDHL